MCYTPMKMIFKDTGKFIPVCDDPSVPRCFKRVSKLDSDGRVIAEESALFNPNVLPDPSTLDLTPPIDLTDPLNYASVMNRAADSMEIAPSVDALQMAQYIIDHKDELKF